MLMADARDQARLRHRRLRVRRLGAEPGHLFCMLKDFDRAPGEDALGAGGGRAAVRRRSAQITGAIVIPFLPPSVQGLGKFGGFQYELLDQSGGTIENLAAAAQQLIGAGQPTPRAARRVHAVHRQRSAARRHDRPRAGEGARHSVRRHHQHDADSARVGLRERFRLQQPVVSRLRAGRQPVPVEPRATSGGTTCGPATGGMMPLDNVVSVREATAPQNISHYNLFRSASRSTARRRPASAPGRRFRRWRSCRTACCRRA